jgi:DHA2 family multidrug resistance protein
VTAEGAPNRRLITAGLMMANVMSSLDTTVVNVAMPHMQGSLSASPEQITWIVSAYMVATAVMTPLSGWLAARIGIKPMLMLVVVWFTAASMLCGVAASLQQIVVFRMLQGVGAAPIAPLCQAVLFNINPPERYGRAMATFIMSNVLAPVVGPIVGAYLTETLSWRWCFFINLPAGIGSILLLWAFLPKEAPVMRRFDFLGFGSLALAVASFQLMLDRGPSRDWFSSAEVCFEAVLAACGLWVFVMHSLTAKNPLFPVALFRDRNFVATTTFSFFFNMPLFAGFALLPLLMQGLLGYPVVLSGLLSVPRGIAMMTTLVIVGRLDSVLDRRMMIITGLCICVLGYWQMTRFDLVMDHRAIIGSSILQGIGQALVYVPISTLSFVTLSPTLRADASAAANLLRFLSGGLGISIMQAFLAWNSQSMHASLATFATATNPMLRSALGNGAPGAGADPTPGLLALNGEITRQATMVAYMDGFWLMVALGVACAPLILLFRMPRRTPGAPREPAPLME